MTKFSVFYSLFAYKNLLTRRRRWILTVVLQIVVPLFLFVGVWHFGDLVPDIRSKNEIDHREMSRQCKVNLFIVPNNGFTEELADRMDYCLQANINNLRVDAPDSDGRPCHHVNLEKNRFDTEEDILRVYESFYPSERDEWLGYAFTAAIIFKNNTANYYTRHFKYALKIPTSLSKELYAKQSRNPVDLTYEVGFVTFQKCIDEEIINMKNSNRDSKLQIDFQEMPRLHYVEPDIADEKRRQLFCAVIMLTFLITLCVEVCLMSREKFSGVNMLMSVHNISYCFNLFTWLMSQLLWTLILTIPIVLFSKYYYTEHLLPILQYGNSFIFWIMLTLNIAHLITFAMHISAYFNRPSFAILGVFLLYVSSTVLLKYGIEEDTFRLVPFLGIILPNIILFRTCEEFNYYEKLERSVNGVHWNTMFEVGIRDYGLQGSVGMMLVFSIIGIIFHFAMANYVYAMNPGKYGIKKSPFSFIKYFKNSTETNDYNKVENVECYSSNNKLFEAVQKDSIPEIQIRKLSKTYRINLLNGLKKCALKNVSVDFFEKQTTALLGYSGSGKTSLLSILTGSISPSEGLVLVNGNNVISRSDELTSNLGFCPQENVLFPDLCVAQQLCFFSMLKNPNKSKTLIDVEVRSVLEKLNLSKRKTAFPNQLTSSEKRRVCLGIALIGNPKILILDEPTLGLNAEEKHHIWKLLLRMNGQNTILIGTRDTEEADVLGDAVAMLHEGELKCYGSPNYLKKLLGYENLQVTLDTDTQSELEKICDYFDIESEVIGINHEKIILSVPDNDELPDSLDKVESNKEELGVTGINVSSFTLEKVYLEATYDNSAPLASREPSCSTVDKLDNEKQSRNVIKSLICKKATYTMNNMSTILIILTMFFISLLCASLILISESEKREIEMPIKIDMYNSITASYFYDIRAGLNPTEPAIVLGNNYVSVIEEHRARVLFNPYVVNLQVDKFNYSYHNLVGAEFKTDGYDNNDITATALYNPIRAKYALPISINLVSNAVLRTVLRSRDCSIEVSYGELAQFRDDVTVGNLTANSRFDGYVVAVILVFFIFPAVAFFVVHPLRESLSNVNHLQRIAGVSAGAYWGIMFSFDFIVLLVISAVFVIKFVIVDLIFGLDLFGWPETLILLLLFVLFAINVLPLIYAFSFRKKSAGATIVRLTFLPICLVLVDLAISIGKLYSCEDNHFFNIFRRIQKGFFLIIPYVSFFHGQLSFFNDVKVNSECRKITNLANERVCELTPCCNMICTYGSCSNAVYYFKNFENDIALETSILALCLTPILYFSILFILECKLIPKLLAKMSAGMPDNSDVAFEEQVKKVKHEIAFEASKVREKVSIEASTNGDLNTVENGTETALLVSHERKDYEFIAYELRKLYGDVVAIEDVSFGVQLNECFGLIGASGAGKTTILRMITGQEMPNHGMINLRDERQYEGMGYCPQNEALIKTLNAYDHLRLFARLRGVADRKIDREVTKWVDRLNLNDCASQPTETYSSGCKRRLNIALALIGHPKLVLLDEPTKNLDPATRQSLWKIIQSCQIGQATILATDSMEECLTLCKSHALMVDGRFIDIGPSEELKQRLRTGYEIRFNLKYETTNDEISCLKKEISKVFPCGVLNEIPRFLKFHISPAETTWRKTYDLLIEIKDKFSCIEEFYVLTSVSSEQFESQTCRLLAPLES